MNPAASKRKGRDWENAVVEFLGRWFPWCERRRLAGAKDKGDIAGVRGWVIECKAGKSIELGPWLDETEVERVNAGARWGALVVKRRMRPVGEAFVVMTLDQFAVIAAELEEKG